jgi:hypothetical protein
MTSAAQAQASRTWVSGLGDDANPCSRTAPCKTFPGAYSKTAVGGEIDVIDPGGFGTISIGHSITIDGGGGVMASILATSGINAVNINAGSSDDIVLRNLTLTGLIDYSLPGGTGVAFNSGRSLSIEHCVIEQFTSYGVFMNTTTSTRMNIANSEINHVGLVGIYSSSSGSNNAVNVTNTSVVQAGTGVQAHNNASIQFSYGMIGNNVGDGVFTDGTSNSNVTVESSTVTANNNGVHATNGTIRIGHNAISFNNTGMISVAPGKVLSWMDNRVSGNSANGVPDAPQLTYL